MKSVKKRGDLLQNIYLNFPDLQFFNWCYQQFGVNRGIYSTIDQWFYDLGIKEVVLRRIYILSFLQFIRESGPQTNQQKVTRFGNGGLKNQLTEFIKSKS